MGQKNSINPQKLYNIIVMHTKIFVNTIKVVFLEKSA